MKALRRRSRPARLCVALYGGRTPTCLTVAIPHHTMWCGCLIRRTSRLRWLVRHRHGRQEIRPDFLLPRAASRPAAWRWWSTTGTKPCQRRGTRFRQRLAWRRRPSGALHSTALSEERFATWGSERVVNGGRSVHSAGVTASTAVRGIRGTTGTPTRSRDSLAREPGDNLMS